MFIIGSKNLFVHVDGQLDESSFPKSKDLKVRQNYLFNSGIAQLEEADFILIVGSNPRFEAPLVNSRIRKAWRNGTIEEIAVVAPKNLDLLYDYVWAGDDVNTLSEIYSGNHPVAKKLKSFKNAVVILGQQILKSNSPSNAYDLTRAIASKYNAYFNVLHANASQVAAFDLGYKPSFEIDIEQNGEPSLLWLFGVDDSNLRIPNNCFVVYQVSTIKYLVILYKLLFFTKGHTGEIGANQADLVLPGAAFTEKQGTYVNMEGRAQQTLAAITPPSMARVDWHIIRAVSEISNHTIPYDTLVQLRSRMSQIAPHLVQYNKNLAPVPSKVISKVNVPQINSNQLLIPLQKELVDYYQTDVISRASATMAKCVQAVSKELHKRQANEKVAQFN